MYDAAVAASRECTERAAREAAALIGQARDNAEALRAETAARLHAAGEEELTRLIARAEDEAHTVGERTAQRLPALVERVLAHVRIELSVLVRDDAEALR